jgi:hypothetical protein
VIDRSRSVLRRCSIVLFVLSGFTPLASAATRRFTLEGVETSRSVNQRTLTIYETENLFAGSKKVGLAKIACSEGAQGTGSCHTTFRLKAGDIRAVTPYRVVTYRYKVLGGTGAYKGEKGTITAHFLNATGTKEQYKFNL